MGEVGVVDLEANLFLKCSLLGGVDVLDPEARIYFLRCSPFIKIVVLILEAGLVLMLLLALESLALTSL